MKGIMLEEVVSILHDEIDSPSMGLVLLCDKARFEFLYE
jgi:hypothetical protein